MKTQPKINVGIIASEKLHFAFTGSFQFNNTEVFSGEYSANILNDQVVVTDDAGNQIKSDTFLFIPNSFNSIFELKNVIIGINFHWEQQENQQFQGALKLIPENGKVRAINIIDLEEYLKSVISSEMSATSSPDLLKAHAVISRSWLLAQIEKTKSIKTGGGLYQTSLETENEIIRWYDREDHQNFDVCADDHCQRYQGISKIHSAKAIEAIEATFGEVLMHDDNICDARFSKCCGGISENFENVWEPVRHPYLTKVVDSEFGDTTCVDLRQEEEAELWIRNKPHAFCNTTDQQILTQVLPNFDQQTTDFYRWKVEYTQNELSELIKKRSGIDFGEIIKLEAVQRGHSARIIKLIISGTKKTLTVGKELEIRKWLSNSHLYSSAFVIDHLEMVNGIPQKIVLTGAGWGHGVGLCQIGAAVMGEKGYSYKAILNHYFRGAELKKLYQ
ncbi:MAG TPA: SpoIID/LytB domain-containing protein [Draconibacterium sp.]|nr:SpoIID/LytB domain-containing protein [Draconibacterium sp.]